MEDKIAVWKKHVAEVSSDPGFQHYEWFVRWHLEIVEQIALELCDVYAEADRDLVQVMVWLHDYGKAIVEPSEWGTSRVNQSAPHSAVSSIRLRSGAPDSSQAAPHFGGSNSPLGEYDVTTSAGTAKLTEMGFAPDFVERAVSYIAHMNKKLEVDLHEAPLEVQIVASADGCSHMVGPFMAEYWRENASLSVDELLQANIRKLTKDWERKIVLPEAREAFAARRAVHLELAGELPEKYLS